MKHIVIFVLMLCSTAASAEMVKIPWKGDYAHNSTRVWSRENKQDSGFSKNFNNGAPEEHGKVQKDGMLWAEIELPEKATGPVPFVILMHGCNGMSQLTSVWAEHVVRLLNAEGIGVLVLDSFSTRGVEKSCGLPDLHWARRRADDAYSALDYLIEKKLGSPDQVYLMGQSGGGTATLVAMSKEEASHPNKFAGGFPIVPSCIETPVKYGDYVRPMKIFVGSDDDANPSKYCIELTRKKRSTPVKAVVYRNANHGFMENYRARVVYGWTDTHGKIHNWTLSYNQAADEDMMKSIISTIKTKKFEKGIETR